jgi:hypothetical protein
MNRILTIATISMLIALGGCRDRRFQKADGSAVGNFDVEEVAPPEILIDRNGNEPRPGDPPPPPRGALAPPAGAPADSGPLPARIPDKAILRIRSRHPVICGQDAPFPSDVLDSGADYNVLPGRAHCSVPVEPTVFDVAAGHIYDFVQDGNRVTVRDVTAGR